MNRLFAYLKRIEETIPPAIVPSHAYRAISLRVRLRDDRGWCPVFAADRPVGIIHGESQVVAESAERLGYVFGPDYSPGKVPPDLALAKLDAITRAYTTMAPGQSFLAYGPEIPERGTPTGRNWTAVVRPLGPKTHAMQVLQRLWSCTEREAESLAKGIGIEARECTTFARLGMTGDWVVTPKLHRYWDNR